MGFRWSVLVLFPLFDGAIGDSKSKEFGQLRYFIVQDSKNIPDATSWLLDVLRILGLIQIAIENRMGIATDASASQDERLIDQLIERKT